MIQVEEALSIIAENSNSVSMEKIKVSKALGYILAETIYSPLAIPPFRQSLVDGYAFIHSEKHQYDIVGTLKAGDHSKIKLQENTTVRVFEGAFVPHNADTIVKEEYVMATEKSILITRMPEQFENVRNKGEEIGEEEIVFDANTLMTPGAIGLLSRLGITEIEVYKKPKVAILLLGKDQVKPGNKLPKGKIYESNTIMLQAALQTIGIKKTKVDKIKNNQKAIKELKGILNKYDIVLISGESDADDSDFVKEGLLENGVQKHFSKINQKPDKAMFFGSKNETLVFTLPKNPASSIIDFYLYVYPAIKNRMGFADIHLKKIVRKLNDTTTNTTGRTLFLSALHDETHVTVLNKESLPMLNTFAIANSLLVFPADVETLKKGQLVTLLQIE